MLKKEITRYEILREAYVIYNRSSFRAGLCLAIKSAIMELTGEFVVNSKLSYIIPLFDSHVLCDGLHKLPHSYWWPVDDRKTRLEALEFLIGRYETDYTNVFPIIKKFS